MTLKLHEKRCNINWNNKIYIGMQHLFYIKFSIIFNHDTTIVIAGLRVIMITSQQKQFS